MDKKGFFIYLTISDFEFDKIKTKVFYKTNHVIIFLTPEDKNMESLKEMMKVYIEYCKYFEIYNENNLKKTFEICESSSIPIIEIKIPSEYKDEALLLPVRINFYENYKIQYLYLLILNLLSFIIYIYTLTYSFKLLIFCIFCIYLRTFKVKVLIYLLINPYLIIVNLLVYLLSTNKTYYIIKKYSIILTIKELDLIFISLKNVKINNIFKKLTLKSLIFEMIMKIEIISDILFKWVKMCKNLHGYNESNFVKKKIIITNLITTLKKIKL